MNAQDITSLAHKVSSFVAELDADDLRDDLLARAHLQRRRPVLRTFSSIGLVGFGAMAAFATVLFVPQVREFFVGKGNDADDAREKIGTKARMMIPIAKKIGRPTCRDAASVMLK